MQKGELAEELFLKGYNCAQSVAGAYAEEMEMDFDSVVKLASSFGGGMGRMREVCGAVSGMFLAAGAIYGYDEPRDMAAKKEHYERIQLLAARFKEKTGSIICRDLLGSLGTDTNPTPDARSKEYYRKRPCAKMVRLAAEILEGCNSSAFNCAPAAQLAANKAKQPGIRPLCRRQTFNGPDSVTVKP